MDIQINSECILWQDQKAETTVDLNTDTSLQVDISDALSERDKVKFTVHTKVSLLTLMSFFYFDKNLTNLI